MVKSIYLKVRPQKLDLSVLAQIFNQLNRLKRISGPNAGITNSSDKAWYLKRHHQFVPVKLAEGELGDFVKKYELNLNDLKTVKGGNQLDLQALAEASYQELDNTKSFVFPASRVKAEPNQTLEESILNTIHEMEEDPNNSIAVDQAEHEEDELFDISEAVQVNAGARARGFSFLDKQNESVSNISRSLLDTGELDSAFYDPPVIKPRTDIPDSKSNSVERSSSETRTEVPVMPVKTNLQLKLDASQAIPTWKKGSSLEESARLTERYINDLKRLKKLEIEKSDAWVINTSLLKSGRSDFYMELPAGADEDIDKYIEYLQSAYGQSKVSKRKCLANIKQEANESPHSFMSRIVNMYFNVRSEEPKSLEDVNEDDNEAFDILTLYLKGLRNDKVRTILKSKIDDLDLTTICDQTRNLTEAYGEVDNEHVINLVHSTSDMNTKIDDLSKKLESISINYAKVKENRNNKQTGKSYQTRYNSNTRYQSRFNDKNRSRFQGHCNFCGNFGHKIAECRKKKNSDKTRGNQYQTKTNYRPGDNIYNKNNSSKNKFTGKCHSCGLFGHKSTDCRKPKS